jgi:hypothetical protein
MGQAIARLPYQCGEESAGVFSGESYKQEFTQLKHLLANMGVNVPTLYKQYTETYSADGVAFLGFNVDPDFADCIDGLVVADLSKMDEKRRKRYLPEPATKKSA